MERFNDIRPYNPEEMRPAFDALLADRHFNAVMHGLLPWLPKAVRNCLLRLAYTGVKTPLDFQLRFMKPVVNYIIRTKTDGCMFDDTLMDDAQSAHTFLSNHRDIVLDSAFLDVMLVNKGYPTTVEIGIGNNLLIYPWIERLVRMNKAFIVRRGLSLRETLEASRHMSSYIHYAVMEKKENIWIAQREGRAKDSSDQTQEAVLKMLAMGETAATQDPTPVDSLRELNIVPLSISYEYDPCDYLKAQEFQLKRDNPGFKKSKQDDLDNMRTGIMGKKGRVTYRCGRPVNEWIDELARLPKNEFYAELCRRIDHEIHSHYELYPCNYIAYDLLQPEPLYAGIHYSDTDRRRFMDYIEGRIAKVSLPEKDEPFLRQCLLTMYANPCRNKMNTNVE